MEEDQPEELNTLEIAEDDTMTFFPTIRATEAAAKAAGGKWVAVRLVDAPEFPIFRLHEDNHPLIVLAIHLRPDNTWSWTHLSPGAKQIIGSVLQANYRHLAADPLDQWCYLAITKQPKAQEAINGAI